MAVRSVLDRRPCGPEFGVGLGSLLGEAGAALAFGLDAGRLRGARVNSSTRARSQFHFLALGFHHRAKRVRRKRVPSRPRRVRGHSQYCTELCLGFSLLERQGWATKQATKTDPNSSCRIRRRLDKKDLRGCSQPMMTARNIHYEIAEPHRSGIASGGIGLIHATSPAGQLGLIDALDRRLELLKIHLPYHESGPCAHRPGLSAAVRRHLPARPGAPPPGREGLVGRPGGATHPRPHHGGGLLSPLFPGQHSDVARHHPRRPPEGMGRPARGLLRAERSWTWTASWSRPPASASGAWTSPTMGPGGYHALVLTLANTGEVLSIVNRPWQSAARTRGPRRWSIGPRPSASAAASGACCCVGTPSSRSRSTWTVGTTMRGSTSSSASRRLPNLRAIAHDLPASARGAPATCLARQATVKTITAAAAGQRQRSRGRGRQFDNQRLRSEEVAEFNYRPPRAGRRTAWWSSRRTSRWKKASSCLFRSGSCTSSTSPTTG